MGRRTAAPTVSRSSYRIWLDTSKPDPSWSTDRPLVIRASWSRVMPPRGSPGLRHRGMGAGWPMDSLPSRTSTPTMAFSRDLEADQPFTGVFTP